jgi:hypothetical protein
LFATASPVKVPSDHCRHSTLRLYPSRSSLVLMCLMCLMAALAVSLAHVPLVLKLIASTGILGCAAIGIFRWHQTPVYCLTTFQQQWQLLSEGDKRQTLQISFCYYWSPSLIILSVFNANQRKKYLPIFPDMCTENDFHRLRVMCRFELPPAQHRHSISILVRKITGKSP